jgi:hypothetical protein
MGVNEEEKEDPGLGRTTMSNAPLDVRELVKKRWDKKGVVSNEQE